MTRRIACLGLSIGGALVMLAAVGWAAELFLVEDWSRHALGVAGVPEGWRLPTFGSGRNDFTVVNNDGHRVLHMRSRNDSSTIVKDIRKKVDLGQTPVLEWAWRVVELPRGGHSCRKATDDQGAQIYVVWERFPSAINSRVVGYVWDTTGPAGTTCRSEKSSMVTYVILRSGTADLGRWVTERRNVVEDYRRIYGDLPASPDAISIAIDSDDVKASAEAFFGPIAFKRS